MEYKKNVVDLTEIALAIIILGVAVSIGAVVLINIRDNRMTELSTVSVTNESVVPNGPTATTLTNKPCKAVVGCMNATEHYFISSGNYTAAVTGNSGSEACTVTNTTATFPYNWVCNYTYYNTTRADYTTPDKAATGLGEYGSWFKILVIVAAAALIMTIIFMSLGRNGRIGGDSGSY